MAKRVLISGNMKHSQKIARGIVLIGILTLLFSINFANAQQIASGLFENGLHVSPGIGEPYIWKCGETQVFDDSPEPGRISDGGESLEERLGQYLFEGEQLRWDVLVYHEDGINNVADVFVATWTEQNQAHEEQANCFERQEPLNITECSDINGIEFDPEKMKYYVCPFIVETYDSMLGVYLISPETRDIYGNTATIDEFEEWFFNPVLSLTVNFDGPLFDTLGSGETAYSSNIEIINSADEGSDVYLDMFISGTDFYDASGQAVGCSDELPNKLELTNFRYFAENGVYSTIDDLAFGREVGAPQYYVPRNKDSEGFVNIGYGIGFNDPNQFYDGYEIIQAGQNGAYYDGNILPWNATMNLHYKLTIPRTCRGTFDVGQIYVWGEAI